jgi:hypothetical protein
MIAPATPSTPSTAPVLRRSRVMRFRALAVTAAAAGVALRIFVSNDAGTGYADAQVGRAVLAISIQAQRIARDSGLPLPVLELLPTGAPKPAPIAGKVDAWLHCVPVITDDPTAQAYHEVGPDGSPDGYVSVAGVDFDGFTEALSHEVFETQGDPGTAEVVVDPRTGWKWPRENSDSVQANDNGQRLPVDVGDGLPPIYTANSVLPAYFDPATPAGTKLDYLGVLKTPFSIGPYGYSAIDKGDGSPVDVFGPDFGAAMLKPEQLHPESRIQIRRATMEAARLAA